MELRGRTAIVTGGASGIGRATAEALARDGATVVVVDIDEEQGPEVATALGGTFVHADLTRREACREVVDRTLAAHGGVDILVNIAGIQKVSRIEDFPEDAWDRIISLMLTAPFLLTRYAWPSMRDRGWGRVVNVDSIHGLVASPSKAAYVSAKHGLIGLTKTTALEGGPLGITVNAICPAYVRTPLVEGQIADQAADRGISADAVVEQVMLEPAAIKHLIEPGEVADLVTYLCSEKARSVTGASWTIDLGWTAR